jgi:hypothetical protein
MLERKLTLNLQTGFGSQFSLIYWVKGDARKKVTEGVG